MTISARVVRDSISLEGHRLTTFELYYPRSYHAELLTHRVFSRNASSSRTLPTKRQLSMTAETMVYPLRWGSNIAGMQAGSDLPPEIAEQCKAIWEEMAAVCRDGVSKLAALGLHKQWANRPSEWFSFIKVVVTSTEWDNFYELRRHSDAQPEIQALANAMWEAHRASVPRLLKHGEWHLPYITTQDYDGALTAPDETLKTDPEGIGRLLKVSLARCARVSYLAPDGTRNAHEKDIELYDRLVSAKPVHASPGEHQATPDWRLPAIRHWANPMMHGNFRGWCQHRKLIEGVRFYG